MDKDRLIAFFSFLIGVLSLLVSIWPSFVQSQALGSLYNFSYWLFFLVRYNLYLIFCPVALVLYVILWKSRTKLFQKSRKVFFFLSIFFVINSVCSSVLLYFRDYSWLTQKGFEYENDGYLIDALQLFNHATMYDRHQENKHVRRVYNNLILSWPLYKAYERQKKDKLSIDATEILCKAALLNKDFSSEILSVRNLQQKLNIKYAEAIRRLRKGEKKYFIDALSEIDSEFHNYGYSKSILDALSNTHAMDTKKAGTDYLIAATEFRILMDEFLLLEKRTPDEVVKKLTREFQIDALCNLRIEKRAEKPLLNETFLLNEKGRKGKGKG